MTSWSAGGGTSGGWIKSSFSNGQCACIEVRHDGATVSIRDSKFRRRQAADPTADRTAEPIITVSAETFAAWLDATRTDELPIVAGSLLTSRAGDGGAVVCHRPTGTCLAYTRAEWSAWLAGIEADSYVAV